MAGEGAVTVIGFKLFHSVIVCGTNELKYVEKGEDILKTRDDIYDGYKTCSEEKHYYQNSTGCV